MQEYKPPHDSLLHRKPVWPAWAWFSVVCGFIVVIMVAGMLQTEKEKKERAAMGVTTLYGSVTPTTSEGRKIL